MSEWFSPWDWTQSDWSGLTFIVVLVGALVALSQAREARKLREEQARPFVIIDLIPVANQFFELTISNIGRTLATNITFAFDPPLETTHTSDQGRGPIAEMNLFTRPIPTLAPGRSIAVFFDDFPDRVESGLPMRYVVEVTYSDPLGRRRTERTVLDIDMYLGTGGIIRHDVHDVHQRLKELVTAVKRWTDSSGLKVVTPQDLRDARAERAARLAERQSRLQGSESRAGREHDENADDPESE